MRIASALRWPWLVMGSVPPVDSIRISDQMMPVAICTEATCKIAMLSSVLPNNLGLTRLTCKGVTTMRVGKNRLPRVQRLAVKEWLAETELGCFTIAIGSLNHRKQMFSMIRFSL